MPRQAHPLPQTRYYRLCLSRETPIPETLVRHLTADEVVAQLPALVPQVSLTQFLAVSYCDCGICRAVRMTRLAIPRKHVVEWLKERKEHDQ